MDCFVATLLAMTEEDFIPIGQLPLFRWIAGSSPIWSGQAPAMTKRNYRREVRMQFRPPKLGIALLLLAPLLAGCWSRAGRRVEYADEDDDTFCRANHVAAGSPEYIACRKDRTSSAITPRPAPTAPARLGEYMVNHPEHP